MAGKSNFCSSLVDTETYKYVQLNHVFVYMLYILFSCPSWGLAGDTRHQTLITTTMGPYKVLKTENQQNKNFYSTGLEYIIPYKVGCI
jgi:hypothetical protein